MHLFPETKLTYSDCMQCLQSSTVADCLVLVGLQAGEKESDQGNAKEEVPLQVGITRNRMDWSVLSGLHGKLDQGTLGEHVVCVL